MCLHCLFRHLKVAAALAVVKPQMVAGPKTPVCRLERTRTHLPCPRLHAEERQLLWICRTSSKFLCCAHVRLFVAHYLQPRLEKKNAFRNRLDLLIRCPIATSQFSLNKPLLLVKCRLLQQINKNHVLRKYLFYGKEAVNVFARAFSAIPVAPL